VLKDALAVVHGGRAAVVSVQLPRSEGSAPNSQGRRLTEFNAAGVTGRDELFGRRPVHEFDEVALRVGDERYSHAWFR
jgi:hypothetical protein